MGGEENKKGFAEVRNQFISDGSNWGVQGGTTHRSNCRHQLQSSMRSVKISKDIVEIMEQNFMIYTYKLD